MCVCVCVMILSLKRHSSFSIALINPCCSHSFPVRVFCFRCPSMQLVALFFYSDNFSYATNLHKKIKQQQQQRQQRQRPRRKIVALLFFFICIGRWGRGKGDGEGVFLCRRLLLLLLLLFLQLRLIYIYSIYRYICKFCATSPSSTCFCFFLGALEVRVALLYKSGHNHQQST